jgi:hypothetical protein
MPEGLVLHSILQGNHRSACFFVQTLSS